MKTAFLLIAGLLFVSQAQARGSQPFRIQVIQKVSVGPGMISVPCPAGSIAIAGGVDSSVFDGWTSASRPLGNPPTAWRVRYTDIGAEDKVTAFAVCLSP